MRTYFPSSTGDSNWDMDDVQVVEKATAGAKGIDIRCATISARDKINEINCVVYCTCIPGT
jgi:hypothetical protein